MTCAEAQAIAGAGLDFGATTVNIGADAIDISEFRLSSSIRYAASFHPERSLRFVPDATTLVLYHFDETTGSIVHEAGGDGGLNAGFNGATPPTWSHCGP